MTLTPTQEQILDFVHTYRSSLSQSKNPHMDYFFRLEGATVSIYKSGKVLLQGNDLTPYLAFFGQDAGNPKGSSTSSAGQDLAMIGTDEVGNGSYFGGLTVVASFVTPDQYDWLNVNAFNEQGRPQHQRGVSSEPGVYFLVLPLLQT